MIVNEKEDQNVSYRFVKNILNAFYIFKDNLL